MGRMTERAISRYYLTGEKFDARAAAECGLITHADDELDVAVEQIAEALRAGSPQGLAETKQVTTRDVLLTFDDRADDMQALSARLFASEEAREGMLAFLQKRPPRWSTQ